jgi:hypothetical protein
LGKETSEEIIQELIQEEWQTEFPTWTIILLTVVDVASAMLPIVAVRAFGRHCCKRYEN